MNKTEQLTAAVEALSVQLRAHEAVLSALARRLGLTADDVLVALGQPDMLDSPQHLSEVLERVRRILEKAGATD